MSTWHQPSTTPPSRLATDLDSLDQEMRTRYAQWAKWPDRHSAIGALARWVDAVGRSILAEQHLTDEYMHDLDKRRTLHNVLSVAHDLKLDDLLDWMIPIVDATDGQFRKITTTDTDGLVQHQQRRVPQYWWYRRVTTNPFTLRQFHEIKAAYKTPGDEEE